jgi:hypothetical protein
MRLTGGQDIAPKIHQHFIPGLVKAQAGFKKKKRIKKRNKQYRLRLTNGICYGYVAIF